MNEEVKLKPCPFCGEPHNEVQESTYGDWRDPPLEVYCVGSKCKGSVGPCSTRREAIAAWNHRPLEDAKDVRIADLERQLAEATQWRSPETAPRDGMFLALIERDRGFGRKPKYVYPMQFSTHKDGLPNERFFYGFGAYRDELPENGQGDESRFVGWLPLPQVKEEG